MKSRVLRMPVVPLMVILVFAIVGQASAQATPSRDTWGTD